MVQVINEVFSKRIVHLSYVGFNTCTLFSLFVCLGLTSLWNIWGHITTVPACSSGTLTSVLPHRNAMPQTQDTTPHPVTVYRHGANLSLCYSLMWNVTLEYTATHFNVLGETRPWNPSPTFHTLFRVWYQCSWKKWYKIEWTWLYSWRQYYVINN